METGQRSRPQRGRQARQGTNPDLAARGTGARFKCIVKQTTNDRLGALGRSGHASQQGGGIRRPGRQKRQQAVAHEVAARPRRQVRRVVDRADPMFGHVAAEMPRLEVEQGTEKRRSETMRHRADRGEAGGPAAKENAQQHGLRLVQPVMGGDDSRGRETPGGSGQEAVALAARPLLDAPTRLHRAGDPEVEGDPEFPGDPLCRPGSPSGSLVQAVVDMKGAEAEAEAGGAGAEGDQQRGRIRSSGEADHESGTALRGKEFGAPGEETGNHPFDGRMVAVEGLEPPTQRI